ncbi:hypothetical protein [Staphylococcus ratti]|uniref:Mid2-like cell wall stress sensor domain protein n=1 Tax=Staphylococcus ratti TaxID=2892440 RepID=A0ABY3PD92_9STAP|nr:hypothetical protein [Staphylococcus ratti]UEX90291.1 hypothetical protein LN051_01045 [Staphylococcus ratti]
MLFDIFGYILGIWYILFGICAVYFALYGIYKYRNKDEQKKSYKKAYIFAIVALSCALILIILANLL